MSKLVEALQPKVTEYVDRRFEGTKEDYEELLRTSTTLYIGNLSFYTSEDQIHEIFRKTGPVKRVIMGLDRKNKTPCGFCFVEYFNRRDTDAAISFLNGLYLDSRPIRVDIDYGFREGRQYGRGRSGGQVRDEFRTSYDADRGGFGRIMGQEIAALYAKKQQAEARQKELEEQAQAEARGEGTLEGVDEGMEGEEAGYGEERAAKRQRREEEERNPRHRDDEEDEDG